MEKGVAELPHGESDQGCCHGWKFVVYVQPPKPASQRIATMTTMRYAILSAFGRAGGSTTVSTIAFTRRSESQTQSRKSRNPNMHYSFAAASAFALPVRELETAGSLNFPRCEIPNATRAETTAASKPPRRIACQSRPYTDPAS